MKLKTKDINGVLFNKNLYPALFVFFFIFSSGSASVAQAVSCKGPADVVLAIDRSANMAGETKFDTVKSSSVDFIDNLFAIPPYGYPFHYHQTGLAIFNNNIASESLTADYAYIQNVVSNLGAPNSSCKAGEAILKAQTNLSVNGNSEATKTIIILIGGPPDNLSFAIEQVGIAKESGTRVISVGINLDELSGQNRIDAENFISNDHIPSYDCYYASDNPDAALDGCVSISTDDLNSSLNAVYDDITEAVCDEIAPDLEIHRIPSGALYNIDKLKITSIAIDDVGFQSHLIVWSDNWPSNQQEVTNCSLVGKIISCDTGELGPFAVGKTINFGSSATDANDNVITIDPLYNFVKVAAVSLSVPALLRNKNNEISVQISDYSGADEFYIRIDNGGLIRVINEENASSKMSCSGAGSVRDCVYSFNPSCASEGVYTDPGNAADVYIYAKSSGITRTAYISSKLNNALGVSSEGITWGNCSNGIDDDCDGIIDLAEISCDSESPAVVIARTSPVETSEVYDDDASITLKSDATDGSGIKRNTIYYRIAGNPAWTTAFDCNDANVDGKCDEDATQSVASVSVIIDSIFPALVGTEIQYYSQAIDYSGNNNTGGASVKSFMVKSRECDEVSNLGACNVTPGGKCCMGVCNAAIANPSGYNTESCAKEICDGIYWQWGVDSAKDNITICNDGASSDGCYAFSAFLDPVEYFFDGGCEERGYRCSSGYCDYSVVSEKEDYCVEESLTLDDYECVGNSCALSPNPAVENDICDVDLDYLIINAYNSDNNLICGFLDGVNGEVLDSKTNQISLISNVTDINGISEYKIHWRKNGGTLNETYCEVCADGENCGCAVNIGSFNARDVISFHAHAKDNSPNQTESETTDYSFTVRDSDCYNIPPGGNKTDLTTFCGPGDNTDGRCCGGSCDISLSNPSSYDDECSKEACIATSWEKDYDGAKEGLACGGSDTCFGYYTGCKNGGNKCSAGYCKIISSGTFIASCSGNNYTTYGCVPDQFGSCQSIDVNVDCSAAGAYDGDGVSCNCDCNGYDIGEKIYSSLSFDGVDDYVTVSDSSSLDLTNNFTISLWAKPTNLAQTNKYVLSKLGAKNNTYALIWEFVNNSFEFYSSSYTGTNPRTGSQISISDTNWHHIVYSYDGSTWTGYRDGAVIFSVSRTFSLTTSIEDLFLGNFGALSTCGGSGCRFAGSIDEVRIYNRALYPEEIQDQYNGIFTDDTGLVEHWNFDEGTGEIAYDSSGNGNDGTLSNVDGILYNMDNSDWVSGKYGSALNFDGVDDRVDTKNFMSSGVTAFTLEAWVIKTATKDARIIYKNNAGNTDAPVFGLASGGDNKIRCRLRVADGSGVDFSVSSIPLNTWTFVACTYDGSNIRVYKDGVEAGSTPKTGVLAANNDIVVIGQNEAGTTVDRHWSGIIDEARIYNRNLSEVEIAEHYNRIFSDETGLVGLWHFDEGTGSTAYDSSENNPEWMKYYHDSISGASGNVPPNWQVCTDGKDNDCDIVIDEYEVGDAQCDGEAESVFIQATAVDRNNVEQIIDKPTDAIYDIDIDQASNDFTLSAMSGDAFGILQTLIEWTTDNWGTANNVACDNTGVCEACVVGGTCDNDIINSSSLAADNVFTYRVCAWDNNNNKACSEDYSFVVPSSNSAPWLSDLEVIVSDFCKKGLEYILSWKFNDDDILDKQSYYEVQVKEGDNDWTTGPFVVDLLKYVSADNAGFSYHPIINGENLEYGEREYYWRVRATDNKTGVYAKTSEWAVYNDNYDDPDIPGDQRDSDGDGNYETFTTPAYKFPQVEFSADLSSDPEKDCFSEICNFGEDIVFHDNTAFFVGCDKPDNSQCLSADAAKCEVGEGQCVACSDSFECSKFDSPNINYSCIAGTCEASGSCANDDDCKSADAAKCDIDSGECVICDDDSQCAQFKDSDDVGYICNAAKCEFSNHRTWDFYGYGDIGSADPDPINNYVESVFDNYDVILKITDITGEYCSKTKNIKFGGNLYPKWNEVSSSN